MKTPMSCDQWICSPGWAAALLQAQCWDGGPSASLKSNRLPKESSSKECKKGAYPPPPSGPMPEPLTQSPGLAQWISLFAAHPARGSQLPGKGLAKQIPETKSQTYCASYGIWNALDSTWKTQQTLFPLTISARSSESWQNSGSMLDGQLYLRQPVEPIISATGSGSMLGKDNWPTPTARSPGDCASERRRRSPSLESIIMMQTWPTPIASLSKGTGPLGSVSSTHRLKRGYLDAVVQSTEKKEGALNPAWVCWLMGWPLGWDSLEPMPATSLADHAEKMAAGSWWQDEPPIPRIDKNITNRAARLKGLGNGMVPLCFVHAFNGLAYENL